MKHFNNYNSDLSLPDVLGLSSAKDMHRYSEQHKQLSAVQREQEEKRQLAEQRRDQRDIEIYKFELQRYIEKEKVDAQRYIESKRFNYIMGLLTIISLIVAILK